MNSTIPIGVYTWKTFPQLSLSYMTLHLGLMLCKKIMFAIPFGLNCISHDWNFPFYLSNCGKSNICFVVSAEYAYSLIHVLGCLLIPID